MHWRWVFMLLVAVPALAWAGECEDDFSECKELCSVQYGGSIRDEMKDKFVKCLRKCTTKSANCSERINETKVNHLNEGALDKSPSSRDVDENGMPILRKRPVDSKPSTREDVREDPPPRPASPPPKPAPKHVDDEEPVVKPKPKAEPPPRSRPDEEIRDDDVVKSDRTRLTTEKQAESPPPPAPKPKAEPAPVPQKKPEPREEPPKRVEPKKDDDDLRNY